MELFDAHTHVDMKHFKNDLDSVIKRAKTVGLSGMVTSSIGTGSFRRTLGIVKKYKNYVYHSAGCQASRLTKDEAHSIISLTRKYSDQVVAIGEVGLDYHWVKDKAGRKAQEPLFIMFIDLAKELNLPIVIHSRKAEAEVIDILEREFDGTVLLHCYDGPPHVSERVRENGWSITLPANFGRYRNRVSAVEIIPLEQIMLETDGPYLSPTEKRNEPANLIFSCKVLADLLELPEEDVGRITAENAKQFYRIS